MYNSYMRFQLSNYLSIDDGINFEDQFNFSQPLLEQANSADVFSLGNIRTFDIEKMFGVRETIYLKNEKIKPVSASELYRSKGTDGSYHAIYIQVNYSTGEYYIGKVNRKSWNELKRYQGSGVKFTAKYEKYKERFARYYLFVCDSEKQTEIIESQLVDDELLNDPFCLNLVKGGGGVATNPHSKERKTRQSAYMKAHPERYKAMLAAAHSFDRNKFEERNRKISKTLSQENYKKMSKDRMEKWKNENPEEYRLSRLKCAKAISDVKVQEKRLATLRRKAQENPDEYETRMKKWAEATHTPAVRVKRSTSLKTFSKDHPEIIKERNKKAGLARRKPVQMIDIKNGLVIMEFDGVISAGQWLIDKGITKSVNPGSSIAAACVQKKIPGHGVKKTAYGYKWKYISNKK